MRLSPANFGRFKPVLRGNEPTLGQEPSAEPPRETILPSEEEPPGQPEPATKATVTIDRTQAEDLSEILSRNLPKVEKARSEGRMGVCLESPSATQIVTATRLRSRLESFLAQPEGAAGIVLTAEEILAAQEIGKCSDLLEGTGSFGGGLRKAGPVLAIVAGAAILYFAFAS